MAVDYVAALKNSRMDLVLAAMDADASAGYMEILASDDTSLVILTFPTTSGVVTADTLDFTCGTGIDGTGLADAVATKAALYDGGDNLVADGLTVGTNNTNVVLQSTSITTGATVTLLSASIKHG